MADKILSIADGLHNELPSITTAKAGRILITTDRGEMYYEPEDKKRIQVNPQADWQQNDETANDYVKNRPGGYNEFVTLVDNYEFTNLTRKGIYDEGISKIIVDENYRVTLNNIVYNLVGKYGTNSEYKYIGNGSILSIGDDTGESFVIVENPEPISQNGTIIIWPNYDTVELVFANTTSGTITIEYYQPKKISEKYLESNNNNIKNGKAIGSLRTINSKEENSSYSLGYYAFAEGDNTQASGSGSHAEGDNTQASGSGSHAEGGHTQASVSCSHAEGYYTQALGSGSHAEGNNTQASGSYSHVEGFGTKASGSGSHAEGEHTQASGSYSHVEGNNTQSGQKGYVITACEKLTDTTGTYTLSSINELSTGLVYSLNFNGDISSKIGKILSIDTSTKTVTVDRYLNLPLKSHSYFYIEDNSKLGDYEISGRNSHAEGYYTQASGSGSHAEGDNTQALRDYSHAEGSNTKALGNYSHAEGYYTEASGKASHAEGYYTQSGQKGYRVIACEKLTDTTGTYTLSSVLGLTSNTLTDFKTGIMTPQGELLENLFYSVYLDSSKENCGKIIDIDIDNRKITVDGYPDIALSTSSSNTVNYLTIVDRPDLGDKNISGIYSHAEGEFTIASGQDSHAEGYRTTAASTYQHVQGKFNIVDSINKYADIIGNGTSISERSNAYTLDWNGNGWFSGEVYVGSTSGTNKDEGSKKLATEEYINSIISSNEETWINVQADWQQNDETANDYIKNRPGGYDALTEILPETTLNFAGSTSLALTNCPPIEVGKKYTVTFYPPDTDKTEYELIGRNDSRGLGYVCIGNETYTWGGGTDTTTPFVIFTTIGSTTNIVISSSSSIRTYNIKIKAIAPVKIPEKYLDIKNTNIVNGSKTGSLRTVGSTKEGSGYEIGDNAFAEGNNTKASGSYSHAEGYYTTASGDRSHAEGSSTKASGRSSHSEGMGTTASGSESHAEGNATTASGTNSHAEGNSSNLFSSIVTTTNPTNNDIITAWGSNKFSLAKGESAHVEGINSLALGSSSHAEGSATQASGYSSHAEGFITKASAPNSHAEGESTTASGYASHAEGGYTTASGSNSHAEGNNTIASSNYQHVQGKYNIEDSNNIYADIIGNGKNDTERSNAATVDWQGNAWYAGDVYVGSTSGANRDEGSKKLATENRTDNTFANALKGRKSGSVILIDDASPVTHDMSVKISPTPPKNLLNRLIAKAYSSDIDVPTEDFINTYCSKKISFKQGTTYTFSIKSVSGFSSDVAWQPSFYIFDNGSLFVSNATSPPVTFSTDFFTSDSNANEYTCYKNKALWTKNNMIQNSGPWTMTITPVKDFEAVFIVTSGNVTDSVIVTEAQIEVGSTATSYVPYIENPITDLTAVKVSRCGKNLIPYPYISSTQTINGITFTVSSDGSITANGTATSNAYLGITSISTFYIPKGNYILSGCPSGGSSTTYSLAAVNGEGASYTKYKVDIGNGISLSSSGEYWKIRCQVMAGQTVKNIIFKPQIELGTTATEYEPYITPTEYTPTADGTVNGVTSLYPNTTLTTDTDGVMIDCEYNRDINKAFAELQAAIISLGGNV